MIYQENRNPLPRKRRLLIPAFLLSLLIFSGCAGTRPAPQFNVPSTAPIHDSSQRIEKSVAAATTHVDKAIEIAKKLDQSNAMVVALSTELFGTKTELQTATGEVFRLQGELKEHDQDLQDQTDRANDLSKQFNTVKPERDAAVAKYHKVKGWFCWEGAAVVFLALLRFGSVILFFIPPPYKYIAYVALPAATYGALWLWL